MADFSNSKKGANSTYPVFSTGAGNETDRVEPLITPALLRSRFLAGIPLYSAQIDPVTHKRFEYTDDILKDYIQRAVADTELETGITIVPTQFDEKHPFDISWWRSFGYLRSIHRPILSVEKLAFTPSSDVDIFVLNPEWIESSQFPAGMVTLIPIVPVAATSFVQTTNNSGGNSSLLLILASLTWVPSIIRLTYTCGFTNEQMPRVINEVIGINAALDVLSSLAATRIATSSSLGADGLNQSLATLGPAIYNEKIKYLTEKKRSLVQKLRSQYNLNFFGNWI